jgi:phage/plasmid-like protein (TIGR03299 family)
MSHEIDFSKGYPAIVTVGKPAWHGLGKTVNKIEPLEALKQAGLDFKVLLAPNIHAYPVDPATGDPYFPYLISEESFFTFRTDTGKVLGDKLGKYYSVLQNSEAIELITPLCEMGFKINVAGALRHGRTIFLTLELGEYVVGNNDKVKTYLVFTNTHDGSRNIYAFFTDVRVVCANTLHLAFEKDANGKRSKDVVKVAKTEQAIEWVLLAEKHTTKAQKVFDQMANIPLSPERFFDYVGAVLFDNAERRKLASGDPSFLSTRKRNLLSDFFRYAQEGPGQKEYAGTVWGAYNAVTGYLGNVKNYKDPSTRTESIWFGESAKVSELAFAYASSPEKVPALSKYVKKDKDFFLN